MAMSPEAKAAWLSARAGKLTASRMADAMSFRKSDGKPTAERTKLMHELLAERITGFSVPHYVTDAMLWGQEHEDEAVDVFVERYPQYSPVMSRFYEHPTIENFGATPDREIGDDGLAEIKCPTTTTFVEWRIAGGIPECHKPQMTAQLLCTGRKYVGFIAYDPRITDPKLNMIVRKFVPTKEEMDKVEATAIQFLSELDDLFSRFVEAA